MPLAWPVIRELLALRERLNRFFEETLLEEAPPVGEPTSGPFSPATDLFETDSEVVAIVEVPGIEASSVDVRHVGNTLRVAGRIGPSENAEAGAFVRMERANGAFFRVFKLPGGVSLGEPEASLDDGVLTVRLLKTHDTRRRRIAVSEEDS